MLLKLINERREAIQRIGEDAMQKGVKKGLHHGPQVMVYGGRASFKDRPILTGNLFEADTDMSKKNAG